MLNATVAAKGPYLTSDTADIILFVPDMEDGAWRERLQADGFLRLDENLWCDIASPGADWALRTWQTLFDAAFPGVRQFDEEEEAWQKRKAEWESAMLIEEHSASRLWK